jgi:hypothetical protein
MEIPAGGFSGPDKMPIDEIVLELEKAVLRREIGN